MRCHPSTLLALTLILLAPAAGPATGQTAGAAQPSPSVDEILARHAAARGGLERWKAVKSLRLTGTQTAFSETEPFTLTHARPSFFRLEQTLLKRPITTAYDGSTAWWINPLFGLDWPVRVPEPDAAVVRRNADLEGSLIGARDKGHKVELAGLGDLDGSPAWQLEVRRQDGAEETWYLDPKTYLEMARFDQTTDFGSPEEQWTYYSDFRPVQGLVLPHHIEMEYGIRNLAFDVAKVEVDAPVDPALFRRPLPEGMTALAPLGGEWQVTVEQKPDPNAPPVTTKTTSTITPVLGGTALQERLTWDDQGRPVEEVRTWSWDRFRKVYRLAALDDVNGHLDIYEGTLADGKLTLANAETRTALTTPDGKAVLGRYTVSNITPTGFRLDWESSRDEGKTWIPGGSFTYAKP